MLGWLLKTGASDCSPLEQRQRLLLPGIFFPDTDEGNFPMWMLQVVYSGTIDFVVCFLHI